MTATSLNDHQWTFRWRFLAGGLSLVVFLLVLPVSQTPLKDEGGYFRMSADLPRYGLDVYRAFDMTSTSLAVIAGGHAAMRIFGQSLLVARAFVFLVSVLGLLSAGYLLHRLGASGREALVFVAVVAVNPLFSRYAHLFTTDALFFTFCQLSLLLFALSIENRRTALFGSGSLLAALAIYTRQPGMVLPLVFASVLGWRLLSKREPPRKAEMLLLAFPYLAFLPLAGYFYVHSGSFFMYVSKPWEHRVGGFDLGHLLWCVNFLGFFSVPFLYPIVRGHGSALRAWRGLPLTASLALTPSILLRAETVAQNLGGLGKIFAALHVPASAVWALVLLFQFSGLLVIALLVIRSLRGSPTDRCLLIFTLLYMILLSVKGGGLLVHYALPLLPASAWVTAAAWSEPVRHFRCIYPAVLLPVALFSYAWAAAESTVGDGIYRGISHIEKKRTPEEKVYTWSATALQSFEREVFVFEASEATYLLITPEDPYPIELTGSYSLEADFPIRLFGLPLGTVKVYRNSQPVPAANSNHSRPDQAANSIPPQEGRR